MAVLSVEGPLVAEEVGRLKEEIGTCETSGVVHFVLDLKETPFIDSASLETIQDIASDAGKRGGDVRIASLNDVCRDIFVATRMDNFIQTWDDAESAVRSLL